MVLWAFCGTNYFPSSKQPSQVFSHTTIIQKRVFICLCAMNGSKVMGFLIL